jgi:hypothetical protein
MEFIIKNILYSPILKEIITGSWTENKIHRK